MPKPSNEFSTFATNRPLQDTESTSISTTSNDYYAATLSGLTAAKRESGKNVVITLNYDVVVEEALRTLDIPISYQLSGGGVEFDPAAGIDESRAEALQVLKLHGSGNWAQKLQLVADHRGRIIERR